jgi:hypothetical protein
MVQGLQQESSVVVEKSSPRLEGVIQAKKTAGVCEEGKAVANSG